MSTDNKPIQVGDLVMVVKVCCDKLASHVNAVGVPWKVWKIVDMKVCCRFCGFTSDAMMVFSAQPFGNNAHSAIYPWLKRIPPLEELEGQRTEEQLREPAL